MLDTCNSLSLSLSQSLTLHSLSHAYTHLAVLSLLQQQILDNFYSLSFGFSILSKNKMCIAAYD